jgi:tetratricopeptide (TPR) repeat protein
LGDKETAIGTYEALCNRVMLLNTSCGGDDFDYVLRCSKVHLRLGQLHEETGDRSRAIEYYEKALEQWKNADEALPELHEARARLERLKGLQ